MRERLRRLVIPAFMLSLAAVLAASLATAQRPPLDRAEAIASRLRCPVCQSTSVADSPSDTARAMRQRIDELVATGATDEEIYAHFTARYGRWVLLEPPLGSATWPLWLLPAGALVVGLLIVLQLGRRGREGPPPQLSEEQRAAVADALARSGFVGGSDVIAGAPDRVEP